MVKRIFAMVVAAAAAAAGCAGDDGGDPEGPAPATCERVVDRYEDCPTPAEICTAQSCGGYDCCYWENDHWIDLITDCFEGCPGNVDAGTDAPDDGPPSDGCGAFDGGAAQAGSALPHC